MITKSALAVVVSLLVLMNMTACTQLAVQPTTSKTTSTPLIKKALSKKETAWKNRQQLMARKANWNLNSKVAVTFKDEHWPFGLDWLQQGQQNYIMQMKNPLTGALMARLTRNHSGVSLLGNDGKTYRSNDEETLLRNQSGIALPLKGMKHWVRGVTSPLYKTDKLILDNVGRPQTLYQAGWKIIYSRYVNNTYSAMPSKISISRAKDDLKVKMIVRKWQGI